MMFLSLEREESGLRDMRNWRGKAHASARLSSARPLSAAQPFATDGRGPDRLTFSAPLRRNNGLSAKAY
jgi:hypothetical protein